MSSKNSSDISVWLVDYIAKLVRIPAADVATDQEFTSFGIDSTAAVGLAVDLGDWVGMEIDPTLVYDYSTIETISRHVADALLTTHAVDKTAVAS